MPRGNITSLMTCARARASMVMHTLDTQRDIPPTPSTDVGTARLSSSQHVAPSFTDTAGSEGSVWGVCAQHRAITGEAKALGMNAMERGELRRRSRRGRERHWFATREVCVREGVGQMLLRILHEEVEGCRGWTIESAMRYAAQRGREERQRQEDNAQLPPTSPTVIPPSRGEDVPEGHKEVRLVDLCRAIVTISAVLNHLSPLIWALTTLVALQKQDHTSSHKNSKKCFLCRAQEEKKNGEDKSKAPCFATCSWEEALGAVDRLLVDPVPAEVVAIVAPQVTALIPDAQTQLKWESRVHAWCHERFTAKGKRDTCFELIHSSIPSLKSSKLISSVDTVACILTLHSMNERELLSARRSLLQQVREQLCTLELSEAHSISIAKRFKEDCDSFELRRKNEMHQILPRFLSRLVYRRLNPLHIPSAQRGKRQQTRLNSGGHPSQTRGSPSVSHDTPSPCCWQRAVLTVWCARREDVLSTLHTRPSSLVSLGNRLRAMVQAGQWMNTHTSLSTALLQWDDKAEKPPMKVAVELVVFLCAAQGENPMTQFTQLLNTLRTVPTAYDALRDVPDALLLYLIDNNLSTLNDATSFSFTLEPMAEFLACAASPCALRHTFLAIRAKQSEKTLPDISLFLTKTATALPWINRASLESMSPPMPEVFLTTLLELLCHIVLDSLRGIPPKSREPPPRWLREALWGVAIPLATWALHHWNQMQCVVGSPSFRILLELCHALIVDLVPRWDYTVVPTRRQWRRMRTNTSLPIELSVFANVEYEADGVIPHRVVSFASFLEGFVTAAAETAPDVLRDGRDFSRLCNAAGLIVADVDSRTGHQILLHLLRLTPSESQMDAEAHTTAVRCLALMRHGCTLWENAISHYRSALRSESRRGALAHVDFATLRVLRCIGSAPIPRALRCAITVRLVAEARASGIKVGSEVHKACLYNFTTRMSLRSRSSFSEPLWCDALGWYNAMLNDGGMGSHVLHELPLLRVACLQSLLSQGDWRRALSSVQLTDLVCDTHTMNSRTNKTVSNATVTRIGILLQLCVNDRTQSCATAARELLRYTESGVTIKPRELSELRRLCHRACNGALTTITKAAGEASAAVLFLVTPRKLLVERRVPTFRGNPPIIPPSPIAEEEGELALRLGSTEFSYQHPRYSRETLLEKLKDRARQRRKGDKHPQHRTPLQIRERVTRCFPLLRAVWSEDMLMEESASIVRESKSKTMRSEMDTHYASVLAPLKRLARLRAEKKKVIAQRFDAGTAPTKK